MWLQDCFFIIMGKMLQMYLYNVSDLLSKRFRCMFVDCEHNLIVACFTDQTTPPDHTTEIHYKILNGCITANPLRLM